MRLARIYRLIEGASVVLFFIQALRLVFANLLRLTEVTLRTGQVDLLVVNAHILLVLALVPAWVAPRSRAALPEVLSVSAMLVAALRLVMSLQIQSLQLYAGIGIIAIAAVYMASLLRANWRTWTSVLVVGFSLDLLFRAASTFDISLQGWLNFQVAEALYRIPWFAIQVVLSLVLVIVSRLTRRSARSEPYEPAILSLWSGLALGGLMVVETTVLLLPNVVAHWASVPYAGLVPWIVLATAATLVPSIRGLVSDTLNMFDERVRGLVWIFAILALLVVGSRLRGFTAAGALIAAQFMVVLSLWWIPSPPEGDDVEQVGPNISLGILFFVVLLYLHHMSFLSLSITRWLNGQSLIIILLAAAFAGMPRIFWRDDDPWIAPAHTPRGLTTPFVIPIAILALLFSGTGADVLAPPVPATLRIATYNINGGYDAEGTFQLDLTARTIEAGFPDIVLLQEVDVGRPVSYGVDEVEYLARRLDMFHIYLPTAEHLRGIAILSRWPLVDPQSVQFAADAEQHYGALRAEFLDPVSGRTLTLVDAHLSSGDEDERIEQLALLLSLIGDNPMVALGGDLGSPSSDPVLEQLLGASSFVDPDRALGIERQFTTPARNPTRREDYILLRNITPLDVRQVDSLASDHRLVVVEVDWSR